MGRYDKYKNAREAVAARDEEIKKNQEAWRKADAAGDEEGKRMAHEAQKAHLKEFDEYAGGTSSYNENTGVWSLSDGRRTDGTGVTGNSIYNRYYNNAASSSAKEYRQAEDAYKSNRFSYNPQNDEAYAAYKKEYERLGREAMDDTIARAAAMTGGAASSYAVSAGSAAYARYMDELSDKIPSLRELAYEKYSDEQDKYLKMMNIAEKKMRAEEDEYRKNRAAYKEYENEQSAAENAEHTARAAFDAALIKAQTEGFGSLTNDERTAIYKKGAYYDPSDNTIVTEDGARYAAAEENEGADDTGVSAALIKFKYKGSGIGALSNADIKALLAAGYTYNGTGWVSASGEVIMPEAAASSASASKARAASASKITPASNKSQDDASENKTAEELRKENGTVNIGGVEFTKRKKNTRNTV